MINLFFVPHDYSGSGTYTKELINSLLLSNDINIHIINFNCKNEKEYRIQKRAERLTEIYLPFPFVSIKNFDEKKYAENCLYLLLPLIELKENVIFHFNSISNYVFFKTISQKYKCISVLTLHYLVEFFSYFDMYSKKELIITSGDDEQTYFLREVDHIICVTHFADQALQKVYKLPPEKITVIHNGYSRLEDICKKLTHAEKIKIKRDFGFSAEVKILLFVGSVIEDKGIFDLIKVFQEIFKTNPDLHLVIVGHGEIVKSIIELKEAWGKVTFMGYQSKEILEKLYQISYVGIIPSKFEQCSYTALEMMSYGLPIIASDVPGLNELFVNNENALLFKTIKNNPDRKNIIIDHQDLKKQILKLINNPNLTNIIKTNAHINWKQNYMAYTMGLETITFYNEIVRNIK